MMIAMHNILYYLTLKLNKTLKGYQKPTSYIHIPKSAYSGVT